MDWEIEHTLVCPVTGTGFAIASAVKNMKLILWYKGNYFLRKGNILTHSPFGVIVNGRRTSIAIIHTFHYSGALWNTFKNRISCPGNDDPTLTVCHRYKECVFTLCPYGAKSD
ncbi:anti-adapter protein IraM [Superficieibacter sp. HKU1]|uniref:anti-adapter protein IraM n=1 Tax=Superficieibacter sp. HKU1 TaxID=3031919 RepID=UPI0023E2F5BE|nr:anti-adapter protein IraM [Superficieibacter sp. HKU1]WES70223.1 anti-adapter protein IraM [Superficieibacter sp. HKU1]